MFECVLTFLNYSSQICHFEGNQEIECSKRPSTTVSLCRMHTDDTVLYTIQYR
jgi:hypothetical protein